MRKALPFVVVFAVACIGGLLWVRISPSRPPSPTPVSTQSPQPSVPPTSTETPSSDLEVIRAGVKAAAVGTFPDGVEVVEARRRDGDLSVEMSKEFAEVNGRGSTGESIALQAVVASAGRLSGIATVTVTVGGRVFEGEHSGEWSAIPVKVGTPE